LPQECGQSNISRERGHHRPQWGRDRSCAVRHGVNVMSWEQQTRRSERRVEGHNPYCTATREPRRNTVAQNNPNPRPAQAASNVILYLHLSGSQRRQGYDCRQVACARTSLVRSFPWTFLLSSCSGWSDRATHSVVLHRMHGFDPASPPVRQRGMPVTAAARSSERAKVSQAVAYSAAAGVGSQAGHRSAVMVG
jgi:hypothetical protein